jgi:hypothetical protein
MSTTSPETTLWLPTSELEPHFNVPTTEELEQAWTSMHGGDSFLELPDNIYGACTTPTEVPTGFAVLDLCEVVRETGLGLLRLRGGTLDDMVVDTDGTSLDYGAELNGWHDDPQPKRQQMIQQLMHHDLIPPVRMSEGIKALIAHWKAKGVYVVADTSTLPGCELSTIAFLAKQYEGCFDGILLPRNHDGLGSVTKADAFMETQNAMSRVLGTDEVFDRPIVFIDDAAHHATAFANTFAHADVIMPEYEWNRVCEENPRIDRVTQSIGTIDAFVMADKYLKEKGV